MESPHVIITEASAGSGKTYALAKRYIELIFAPSLKEKEIPLNSILAITFTNKAAIEMKERILEFLKKAALDTSSPLQKKARKITDYLFRNYNFFQVETIDSFINAILSGCAFKLDLSAGFKTHEDYAVYLEYCLDKLIDKAGNDRAVKELFRNFLKYYLYTENQAAWLPKKDILKSIVSLYAKSNKYPGDFIPSKVRFKDIILLKQGILKIMRGLNDLSARGINKNFSNALSVFLERNKDGFDIDDLSYFFRREDLPVNKGEFVDKKADQAWKDIRKKLSQLCELESASIFDHYIEIFSALRGDLKKSSREDDVLFLEALNKEAQGLFNERSFSLPELYYRLAGRFRHFLLDEFQDTSVLQWENLFLMVEEALSTGGSLFYVGDKKQAIYRFRGGEASLADLVKKRLGAFDTSVTVLNKNYRSRHEIVEFNNRVFSKENLEGFFKKREGLKNAGLQLLPEDISKVTEVFSDSRQQAIPDKTGGYVRWEMLDQEPKEEALLALRGKLLFLIKDLGKRFFLGDIALLARTNDEVEALTSWLIEENIAVESEKTLNVRKNTFIKELISFLKFLNSPIDDLSFASFLLGEIFQKASGIKGKKIAGFIFSFKNRDHADTYLYRAFRREFPKAWNSLIEDFFKSVGFVPLYELLVSIYYKFKLGTDFYDHQGFFMRLLELVKENEEEHGSIQSFLEFFEEAPDEKLYVDTRENEAIKILTIHKAKGLEFPVVIIPFFEMNIKVNREVVEPDGADLRLFYLKRRYTDFSRNLNQLYRNEYIKSFIDELNSIYVAFTRPQDELYIFILPGREKSFNLASLLIGDGNKEYGRVLALKRKRPDKEALSLDIPPSEYRDWVNLLKDEFVDESVVRQRKNMQRGEVLHYMLSCIGNIRGQDTGALVKQVMNKAEARFPNISELMDYKKAVLKILEDKQLRKYFDIPQAEVYTEKEVVDNYGNTFRIDRMIVTAKDALVIDYKSKRDKKAGYIEQIEKYKKIVREIYKGKKVKGVLIYLDDLSQQEV
ncbi:MAG: UvrD-helicase domain-containing protein [Candidatus Omnitrophica bacterium]|nr:UvrD-helicase domain-containing protein [Candidatus Omnitrophota bacterium]